ncbi:MAG: hypothetical protein SVY53_08460 [Chloroflexota bacterium]|nr:hypothetical protein [Chloroflexota bacterium]
MTKAEILALEGMDVADMDKKHIEALKYVEHLTLNRGTCLDKELLAEMQSLWTDREIAKIGSIQAFADGTNALSNTLFALLFKLRIVKQPRLDSPST